VRMVVLTTSLELARISNSPEYEDYHGKTIGFVDAYGRSCQ
jgi:hypothetical protein